MSESVAAATIPEVAHHTVQVNGEALHYVTAGDSGTPVLLVHGFPESWWAFRGVIPVLAAGHPELIHSYAAIETGLPGFGLEMLADVAHGGTWHIGVMAAPGIPEMLLTGREREFLAGYAFPAMSAGTGAITEQDIDEFARVYAQPDGFAGASGLYRSMLAEGEEVQRIVAAGKLTMPVLSVGAGTGPFTHQTMNAIAENVSEANLTGVGHLAALEDPEALAETLLRFYRPLDA